MKLYILKAKDINDIKYDPWNVPYDCYFGFVICAENEKQARSLANARAADEGKVWDNPKYVSCKELVPSNTPGIVMSDFNAG